MLFIMLLFVEGYRQKNMTEEQLKKKQQRANKRKQMAHEKREKDKVLRLMLEAPKNQMTKVTSAKIKKNC